RRRLAHDWMAGKGYRGNWVEPTDALYRTEEEINRAFDAKEKPDGCGFGTLVYHARQGGWRSATDIFGDRLRRHSDRHAEERPRLNLMTVEKVFAMPDPEELVSRMLMDRENVCVVGAPKSGKTFIALDIALSLAAGQRVFDRQPVLRSGPVVYLSGEGHAGMKR